MTFVKSCIGILLLVGIIYCLRVVPERAKVVFIDPEYVEYANISVTRYGRKSGYYLNLEGKPLRSWYNNVTVHLIFFEYLHNEYRRTFVELHLRFCEFLREAYIGATLKNVGVTCPLYGDVHLMNLTIPVENFPYLVPFEKFRMDGYVNLTDTNKMIYKIQFYAHLTRK